MLKKSISLLLSISLIICSIFTCFAEGDDVFISPNEEPASLSFSMKTCTSIIPQNFKIGDYGVGQALQFTVKSALTAEPVVTFNGEQITKQADGSYQVLIVRETDNMLSVRISGDEDYPFYGFDHEGRDLTKYDHSVYSEPIWSGDTVYQETVLFYIGRDTAKLLYPIDEVISVRSYGLETEYYEGSDYEITADGQIKILPGSRIKYYDKGLVTSVKPSMAFPLSSDPDKYLAGIADKTFPQYAISVTYKHSKTWEGGYTPAKPDSQVNKIKNTISKLQKGEEVNIVVYGDSISCGWSSSGLNLNSIYDATNTEGNFTTDVINVAPYAPTWADMLLESLKKEYPNATINMKNLSLAGKASEWGKDNIAARLALWKDEGGSQVEPDLMLIGFGVNDAASASGITPEKFNGNISGIINNARTAVNSDMEFLLYSPMLPNQLTDTWSSETKLTPYENQLAAIAEEDEKVGVVKITSIFNEIVKTKECVDYLSTNINHGNDFTARIYATSIFAAMQTIGRFLGNGVRLTGEPALRFRYTLSKAAFEEKAMGNNETVIKIGFVAARSENVDGDFTLETPKTANGVAYDKYGDVNIVSEQDDKTVTYQAALYNIGVIKPSDMNYKYLGHKYSVRLYYVLESQDKSTRTVYDEVYECSFFDVVHEIESLGESCKDYTALFGADGYMNSSEKDTINEFTRKDAYNAWKESNGWSF